MQPIKLKYIMNCSVKNQFNYWILHIIKNVVDIEHSFSGWC